MNGIRIVFLKDEFHDEFFHAYSVDALENRKWMFTIHLDDFQDMTGIKTSEIGKCGEWCFEFEPKEIY